MRWLPFRPAASPRGDSPRPPELFFEPLEPRRLLSGRGLAAYYFEGTDFTSVELRREDAQVNFTWPAGTPHASIGAGGFGARWSGRVMPKYSEEYRFYARTTGGVRLWVNGRLIIDDRTVHPLKDNRGTIRLTAGVRYDIRMELFDTSSAARAELHWASKRQARGHPAKPAVRLRVRHHRAEHPHWLAADVCDRPRVQMDLESSDR